MFRFSCSEMCFTAEMAGVNTDTAYNTLLTGLLRLAAEGAALRSKLAVARRTDLEGDLTHINT